MSSRYHCIANKFVVIPINFLIIPAEELPMLNLPELRIFMAICSKKNKKKNEIKHLGKKLNVNLNKTSKG